MTDILKLIKQTSIDLNEDKELVTKICQYLFKFIKDIMQDETDTHDILINKLFKFKLKSRYKINKQTKYCSK